LQPKLCLYHAIDAAKESSLQWSETKRRYDDLELVGDRIRNVGQSCKYREEPRLLVRQRLDHLVLFEVLILDACLVFFNTLNRFDPFINSQKPSIRWGVRKQEKEESRSDECKCSRDDHEPLPRLKP